MRRVMAGAIRVSPRQADRLLLKAAEGRGAKGRSPVGLLSERELRVFLLIGRGLPTRRIAARLRVSVQTVERHRRRLQEKLVLQDAAALAQAASSWLSASRPGVAGRRKS